jgi:serine/threonine-protein kinase
MNLKVGDRIGDYEILGVLGAGGMGSVYKVRNVISDRVEALKLLLPNLAEHQDLKDRFLREIKTSASLEHTNIAALRTAFQSGDMLLMVMEFVEGETLDHKLKAGPLPIDEAVRYTAQVLDALEYAHSRGVVHRDIKPQNVMVTPKGTAKLLDFGIAKASTDKQLTMTGATLGSLYYMSPEQIRGEPVDGRADLYSLGITLYELVTGKRPFGGDSGYAIMAEHLQKQPVPPLELDPRVPAALNAVILRSLAKKAADRFQDAAEFRQALKSIAFGPSATQPSFQDATMPRAATPAATIPMAPPSPPAPAPQPSMQAPMAPSPQPSAFPATPPATPAFAQPPTPPAYHAPVAPAPAPAAYGSAPRRKNPLALALIAVVVLLMVGAVGLVIASSYFFGGADTTMAAGKQPTLLDRITGMFSSSNAGKPAENPAAAQSGAGETQGPATDPASLAQATQSIPMESIDTGEAPATAAGQAVSQAGITASVNTGTAPPPISASRGARSSPSASTSTSQAIGAASAALASQGPGSSASPQNTASPASAVASGSGPLSGGQGGGYSAPVSAPRVDPKELERTRDFFAKLGIRAGTIQESARKLSQEQSNMGLSLRADIRASLKRMEYLMDRAEAALNNQDLEAAKTQMDLAEREIEKLEKFFRI